MADKKRAGLGYFFFSPLIDFNYNDGAVSILSVKILSVEPLFLFWEHPRKMAVPSPIMRIGGLIQCPHPTHYGLGSK